MPFKALFDDILEQILKYCKAHCITIDEQFIQKALHLFWGDSRIGLLKYGDKCITTCKINKFIDNMIQGITDPLYTPMINLKIMHLMKNTKIDFDYVKEKYDKKFQEQLKLLIDDILQYPETCTKIQLDQLTKKMQVFIIACYNLGSTKNHVLLDQTGLSLNSVIGRNDIQNYVLKKKYHRMEYLQRLSATVAGILIYNNNGPDGDRENARDVLSELSMAAANTENRLKRYLEYSNHMKTLCQRSIKDFVTVNVLETKVVYHCPLERLHFINQFTITYTILYNSVKILFEHFEKIKYLIILEKEHYECVICKLNENLKWRTSIDTELIFPHFVYLSQIWNNLNSYLNYLVELNRIEDELNAFVPDELQLKCTQYIEKYIDDDNLPKCPIEQTFTDCLKIVNATPGVGNILKLEPCIQDYCTLTLVLSNGLLVPAMQETKLVEKLNVSFGFRDDEHTKFAERYYEDFITAFYNIIFTNANLAMLLNLETEMIARIKCVADTPPKTKTIQTQTELMITQNSSRANQINATWNIWDYHRDTIKLANIRKCQTHDTQTKVSYGKRNAQNQALLQRKDA